MSSDVNRQAVFQATKVRTHLKQDGSWINRSQDVQDTQSDVKARKPVKLVKPKNVSSPESSSVSSSIMPCAQSATTSSSLDSSTPPQSSYVISALRKFEQLLSPRPLNSTENTPVRSGSSLAKSVHPVLEDSRRAHVEEAAETSIVKPAEQPLKTPADVPVKDVVEKPMVRLTEESLKTHADTPKMDKVEKPIVKPVEELLKSPADAPVKNVVEKPIAKPVEEPLKTPQDVPVTHADTPKTDVVEKPIAKPVEEPLKTSPVVPVTHADTPKMDVVEKPVAKSVEEPLKTPQDVPVTHADTPKTDVVEKPIAKPVEEPLKTPQDVPVKNIVEKPAEESLKTHTETPVEETGKTPVDGASTDQTQFSGALLEKTVKTPHENPAKPSGTLTTENKEDDFEQVTVAHAPVVEAPLEPRQAENQPTSDHGELSLLSALEPTEEPRVATLEEHHRLNSEAELNVKGKTMCSFCKLPLDGNTKISVNIPAICCHPDCFKLFHRESCFSRNSCPSPIPCRLSYQCNGCSSPLGDLSSSMYHYAGKILCEKCFDQIFQF